MGTRCRFIGLLPRSDTRRIFAFIHRVQTPISEARAPPAQPPNPLHYGEIKDSQETDWASALGPRRRCCGRSICRIPVAAGDGTRSRNPMPLRIQPARMIVVSPGQGVDRPTRAGFDQTEFTAVVDKAFGSQLKDKGIIRRIERLPLWRSFAVFGSFGVLAVG